MCVCVWCVSFTHFLVFLVLLNGRSHEWDIESTERLSPHSNREWGKTASSTELWSHGDINLCMSQKKIADRLWHNCGHWNNGWTKALTWWSRRTTEKLLTFPCAVSCLRNLHRPLHQGNQLTESVSRATIFRLHNNIYKWVSSQLFLDKQQGAVNRKEFQSRERIGLWSGDQQFFHVSFALNSHLTKKLKNFIPFLE